jgi:tRNA pseudouridine38-40 synthase
MRWSRRGSIIMFYIKANRYLHGMVRAITGTLLKVQELENGEKLLMDIFNSQDRQMAYDAVPSKGLFLYKVEY